MGATAIAASVVGPALASPGDALTAPERAAAQRAQVDPAALGRLVAAAESSGSSALLVLRHGRTVVDREWGAGGQQALIDGTATLTSLAVGCLVTDGRVPSVETPVGRWLPDWRDGHKGETTIFDLLTTRVDLRAPGFDAGLYAQPDRLRYVRALPVRAKAGRETGGHAEAAILLGGVVEAAAGRPLDEYLDQRLFKPLGIGPVRWDRDRAGRCDAANGLWMRPRDLARVGELMLQGGTWRGRRLLSRAWIAEATRPHPLVRRINGVALPGPSIQYGFGWQISRHVVLRPGDVRAARDRGIPTAERLAPLVGRTYLNHHDFFDDARRLLPPADSQALWEGFKLGVEPFGTTIRPENGYKTPGSAGQRMVVRPTTGVLAVRMLPWRGGPVLASTGGRAMRGFEQGVEDLCRP